MKLQKKLSNTSAVRKRIFKKIGEVLLVTVLFIFAVYVFLTLHRALDYFNIGADGS